MSIARIWRGSVKDGDSLGSEKVSGLYRLMGGEHQKAASAEPGELVALGRMDVVRTGDLLTETGVQADAGLPLPEPQNPVLSLATRPHNRQDQEKHPATTTQNVQEGTHPVRHHYNNTNN